MPYHRCLPWVPQGAAIIEDFQFAVPVCHGVVHQAAAAERVQFKLEFYKPMAGTCTAEFAFKPEGKQTAVTWSMSGKNNFMAKAVGLFMDCDKMVGDQFETGLANLKGVAEGAAK